MRSEGLSRLRICVPYNPMDGKKFGQLPLANMKKDIWVRSVNRYQTHSIAHSPLNFVINKYDISEKRSALIVELI